MDELIWDITQRKGKAKKIKKQTVNSQQRFQKSHTLKDMSCFSQRERPLQALLRHNSNKLDILLPPAFYLNKEVGRVLGNTSRVRQGLDADQLSLTGSDE